MFWWLVVVISCFFCSTLCKDPDSIVTDVDSFNGNDPNDKYFKIVQRIKQSQNIKEQWELMHFMVQRYPENPGFFKENKKQKNKKNQTKNAFGH